MHRLDRETSGAILFTKQRCVNEAIHKMFEEHKIQKIYHAISFSNKEINKNFQVEKFMGRISSKSSAAKWGLLPESKGGVYSKTDFRLLNKSKSEQYNVYYIEAKPFTGRTHQIRVHLSSLGFPLLGDTIYGGADFERIMLHSKSLEFVHPISKDNMKIEAPAPELFKKYYNL